MNTVFDIAVPVFGLGMLGYFATRFGWFSEQAAGGLATFVFDFAVPCMLLRVLSSTDLPDQVPWGLMLSFYLPAFFVFMAGMVIANKLFGRDYLASVVAGFGSAFGNSILLGLPLVLLAFGDLGAVPFFILLSVHGLLLFTFATILFEFGLQKNERGGVRVVGSVAKGLATNPIVWGLAGGVTMNLLELGMPTTLDRILEYLQQAVIPCSLFSLGASLSRYGLAGQVNLSLGVVALKNFLFPGLVWLLGTFVFGLNALWTMVAVMLAAQPSGVNTYLFAKRYQAGTALATSTIFLSTLVGLGSLSALLYVSERLGLLANSP